MICLGLNISEKLHYQHLFEKLGEAETQELLNNNKDHSRKRGRPPFFHSDTNLVFSHILVHSCRQKLCSSCNSGINLILFLNTLSFNFFLTQNKSFRFGRFRRSYVNCHVVVPTNHCQSCTALPFWLDVHCSKQPRSFFCSCLSPIIVHLLNPFLLSVAVAQMLLTPRWVNRRKDGKQVSILLAAKQCFLLILIQQRR